MAATKTIALRTAIPGPRSQEILQRTEAVIAEPLSIYMPVVIDRGEPGAADDAVRAVLAPHQLRGMRPDLIDRIVDVDRIEGNGGRPRLDQPIREAVESVVVVS